MSKTPPRKLTGRSVVDENGNRSWVWHTDSDVETASVRALGEDLSLDTSPHGDAPPSLNPYDRTPARVSPKETTDSKRRTLDDMRRLSEEIKKAKYWKPDK
jgi:hypothetical protein